MNSVIYHTDMTDLIRKILREQTESKKDAIKSLIKKSGLETAARVMGGLNNIIDIVYDGDLIKFSEDTITPIAYMSTDGLNLYLHEALVKQLGIQDTTHPNDEYYLGKFIFGSKNGGEYSIHTRLSLSDDPEAKEMKERVITAALMMGLPSNVDMNVLFGNMTKMLEAMKEEIDKTGSDL